MPTKVSKHRANAASYFNMLKNICFYGNLMLPAQGKNCRLNRYEVKFLPPPGSKVSLRISC
jgi:hypothetical protein